MPRFVLAFLRLMSGISGARSSRLCHTAIGVARCPSPSSPHRLIHNPLRLVPPSPISGILHLAFLRSPKPAFLPPPGAGEISSTCIFRCKNRVRPISKRLPERIKNTSFACNYLLHPVFLRKTACTRRCPSGPSSAASTPLKRPLNQDPFRERLFMKRLISSSLTLLITFSCLWPPTAAPGDTSIPAPASSPSRHSPPSVRPTPTSFAAVSAAFFASKKKAPAVVHAGRSPSPLSPAKSHDRCVAPRHLPRSRRLAPL